MAGRVWVKPVGHVDGAYLWVEEMESGPEERKGTLKDLVFTNKGVRKINFIAPATDVTVHHLNLPHKSSSVLAKALPYALEDLLAEDVDELHFSVLNREAPDGVSAAVIKRSLVNRWLDDAEAAGLEIVQIVPEVLLLPLTEGQWCLAVDGEYCLVRTGEWSGFGFDRSELGLFCRRLNEAADAFPSAVDQWLPEADRGIDLPPEIQNNIRISRESLLVELAREGCLDSKLTLMQGEFARSVEEAWSPRRFVAAAAVLVLAVLVHIGFGVFELHSLQEQEHELEAAAESQFGILFPHVKRIVDMDVQSQQQLQQLRAGGQRQGGEFLKVLALAGDVMRTQGNLKLTSLRYSDGVLQVQVHARELAALDQMKKAMETEQNVSAELVSATSVDQGVDGRFRISRDTL